MSTLVKSSFIPPDLRERTRDVVTALNLHFAGVAILGLLNLYLIGSILFAWRAASSQNAEAIASQRVALKSAEIAAKPLQGLDVKLSKATENADAFYKTRLPSSYSQVAAELGALSKEQKVKLTRVQYAQDGVLTGTSAELTEVKMDATLTGDYRQLVIFLNNLERDKLFFLISGVTLTGGQAGTVNLRVRLTTYLQGQASEEERKQAEVGVEEDGKPRQEVKP